MVDECRTTNRILDFHRTVANGPIVLWRAHIEWTELPNLMRSNWDCPGMISLECGWERGFLSVQNEQEEDSCNLGTCFSNSLKRHCYETRFLVCCTSLNLKQVFMIRIHKASPEIGMACVCHQRVPPSTWTLCSFGVLCAPTPKSNSCCPLHGSNYTSQLDCRRQKADNF